MKYTDSYLSATRAPAQDLGATLNMLGLAGICLSLAIAFYYQLALRELPCPLCLLQRVGMIAIGLGFMLNVRFGVRSLHYGVALFGCLLTGAIASRQVLLHIVPDSGSYGSALFGMHFYTLALLSAIAAAAFIALLLMLHARDATDAGGRSGMNGISGAGKAVIVIFTLLIAANLVSTVLECGGGQCDDDPSYYQLLGK